MIFFLVSIDAAGKILSGPGRTYLPSASVPAAANTSGVEGGVAGKIKAKPLTHMPPKKIMKGVGQAIKDWNMIEEGDRILLGLSGGKDSLALLHILLAVQVTTHSIFLLLIKKNRVQNTEWPILLLI